MAENKLFYGDNLDVLRRYLRDESVDLIYLDPPFNSRQDYNVLFAEKDGTRSSSQITAFEDTWEWSPDARHAYEEVVERGGKVSQVMQAFHTLRAKSIPLAHFVREFIEKLGPLRRGTLTKRLHYIVPQRVMNFWIAHVVTTGFGPLERIGEPRHLSVPLGLGSYGG